VDEATSARVARELRNAGWPDVRALVGGWRAWLDAGLPVDTKEDVVPTT
jgi:3-mercaptopyruvate sulfurtransferase SseA